MKKKISAILLCLIFIFAMIMSGCGGNTAGIENDESENIGNGDVTQLEVPENIEETGELFGTGENMQIFFVDVGQGDCTFIDYGDYEALIDCGKESYSGKVIKYIETYVDGDLDLIIATHPDADHIGGMDDIIEYFQVDEVIDSGSVKDTQTCQSYIEAVENEENCQWSGDKDEVINLDESGKANIKIIETGDSDSDVNENSVVAQLNYGEVSVLLTGDMGMDTERENLSKFSEVDVLKAAHHGSDKSSSVEFLKKISPDFVIISVGKDNTYGHPDEAALERFSAIGATIYETMDNGTIIMNTDGKTYEFITEGSLTVTEPEDDQTYSAGISGTSNQYTDSDTSSSQSYTSNSSDQSTISYGYSEYIGNKNTKKFHRSSCRYVEKMSDGNKVYFNSRDEALNSGYDGCAVCTP